MCSQRQPLRSCLSWCCCGVVRPCCFYQCVFQSALATPAPPQIAYVVCKSRHHKEWRCFYTAWCLNRRWMEKQLVVLDQPWKKHLVPELGGCLEPGEFMVTKISVSHGKHCALRPCSSAVTKLSWWRAGHLRIFSSPHDTPVWCCTWGLRVHSLLGPWGPQFCGSY